MRCFVAIELPDAVHQKLAALQQRLAGLDRAVRWTPPGQIHLTLKFLGEVRDADMPAVCEAIRRTALQHRTFELRVQGTGCFPPRGPERVVWAGLAEPTSELIACQRGCEQVCAAHGFPPEARAYSPHLTIARTKDRGARPGQVRAALEQCAEWDGGSFTVRELVVFQSILGRGGAQHVALARAPLGGKSEIENPAIDNAT